MAYDSSFPNGYRNELGRLSKDAPARRAGKRMLAWEFRPVASTNIIVEVTVTLENADAGLRFRASSAKLPADVVDTDINRLHATVEQALLEQAAALSGITWDDWYEVIVHGGNSDFADSPHSALGANLHIQVNRLKRGVHPTTGQPVTININDVVVAFPTARSINSVEDD